MGLSSKQVSGERLDWTQKLLVDDGGGVEARVEQESGDPLRCPRCESSNTKFCYYNNYNRSQPRHFCKACRRHWTKGGTLRNVPIGGARKNKRLKTSSSTTTTISTPRQSNTHMEIQHQQLPLTLADQNPQPSLQHNYINSLPPMSQISSFNTISSLEMCPNLFNNALLDSRNDKHVQFSRQLSPWTNPSGNFFSSTSYWNWDDLTLFALSDVKPPLQDPPQGK
ncbi:uncharacterized protein LOC143859221 [Tasmannia lanceolata]|uniref:uncharacterized protein LOC143859221 n=1 Tax=Tasmannia lanceolata TaxID=3420 RepID=UPI004064341D